MKDQDLIDYVNRYLKYNELCGCFVYKMSRGPKKVNEMAGSFLKSGKQVIHVKIGDSRKRFSRDQILYLLENGHLPQRKAGASSKYRGVRRRVDTYRGEEVVRWLAQIYIAKKQRHIGYFKTEREAALAYNAAALEFLGKDAKLNKVDDND
jgi:hypothetical protein